MSSLSTPAAAPREVLSALKQIFPTLTNTALRYIAGGPQSGRDNSAYIFASSCRFANVPLDDALAGMEAFWDTFDQPSGDEYPLNQAIEKVRRLYGEGGGTRRSRDRDARHRPFKLQYRPFAFPDPLWHEGEDSRGRLKRLWDSGIPSIPVRKGVKGAKKALPKWKHLQGSLPTEQDWAKWKRTWGWNEGNHAILLGYAGEKARRLYVIEVEQGEEDYNRVVPFLSETVVVKSSKSYHIYLESDAVHFGMNSSDPKRPNHTRFEFRAHGQYVLGPGSLHASGKAIYSQVDQCQEFHGEGRILVVDNIDGFLNQHFPEFFDKTAARIEEWEEGAEDQQDQATEDFSPESVAATADLMVSSGKDLIRNPYLHPADPLAALIEKPYSTLTTDEAFVVNDFWETYNEIAKMPDVITRRGTRKSVLYNAKRYLKRLQNAELSPHQPQWGDNSAFFPLIAPDASRLLTAERLVQLLEAVGGEKGKKVADEVAHCQRKVAKECPVHGAQGNPQTKLCRCEWHGFCLTEAADNALQTVLPDVGGTPARYRAVWLRTKVDIPQNVSPDVVLGKALDTLHAAVARIPRLKGAKNNNLINRGDGFRPGRSQIEITIRLLFIEDCPGDLDPLVTDLCKRTGLEIIDERTHQEAEWAVTQLVQDKMDAFEGFLDADLNEQEEEQAFASIYYGTKGKRLSQLYGRWGEGAKKRSRPNQKDEEVCPECGLKLELHVLPLSETMKGPHGLEPRPKYAHAPPGTGLA